jgi:DNA-binding response OmpR family regulator
LTAHIPVVALSANAMPRDIEKGLQAGFFRYLTKPIKVDEFMSTLDVALKFARAERVRLATQELPYSLGSAGPGHHSAAGVAHNKEKA